MMKPPKPHVLVIHNPTAGWRRRWKMRRVIGHLRQMGARVTLFETEAPGDATAKAREADGHDVIAVAGGDGTVNEVVNGLDGEGPPVAFIPLGTANVLAWELSLPLSAPALARMIFDGETRRVYPGLVNGRRFVLMVGVGLDAWVVERVKPGIKRNLGGFAYVVALLSFLRSFRFGPYRVIVDGEEIEATSTIITRTRRYAGPFVIAPEAGLEERSLTVVALTRGGIWNVLRYAAALLLGRLHALSDVRILQATRVSVTGPGGDPVQGDGDLIMKLPIEVSVDERPIRLIVPRR